MNEKEQKTEEKQKLHMRLLDAQDAVLISCEGDSVSVDVLGDLVHVGEGLAYALAQNTNLADFFMSVIGATASASIEMGDARKSAEIRNTLKAIIVYIDEVKGKAQN